MFDEKLARHKKEKENIDRHPGDSWGSGYRRYRFTAYVADCQITGSQYGQEEEIENELFPRLWTSAFSISF